ncbi:MAG: SRPBCC family protein [Bacteroidetes bacterium]|nr:SRPBCC family protein [Bacteroidota bacterium]
MTKFKKQVTINASKQSVWKIISNLGDIYKFNPGVSKSYYTTDEVEGVGAARICELLPAGKILETVKSWEDGSGFVLQIDPIEKAPPVKDFTGHFQLKEINLNSTNVSLTVSYEMKLGLVGDILNKVMIKSKLEKGIDALLAGLKVYIEKGMEVKDSKALQEILKAA